MKQWINNIIYYLTYPQQKEKKPGKEDFVCEMI
jgi:hypothetical protein